MDKWAELPHCFEGCVILVQYVFELQEHFFIEPGKVAFIVSE